MTRTGAPVLSLGATVAIPATTEGLSISTPTTQRTPDRASGTQTAFPPTTRRVPALRRDHASDGGAGIVPGAGAALGPAPHGRRRDRVGDRRDRARRRIDHAAAPTNDRGLDRRRVLRGDLPRQHLRNMSSGSTPSGSIPTGRDSSGSSSSPCSSSGRSGPPEPGERRGGDPAREHHHGHVRADEPDYGLPHGLGRRQPLQRPIIGQDDSLLRDDGARLRGDQEVENRSCGPATRRVPSPAPRRRRGWGGPPTR